MGMRRIWGVLVLGLVLTACGEATQGTPSAGSKRTSTTSSTSAAPFEGEVVADGEVVAVDKLDGVSLKSPDDGRLRNYGVATEVLDFGTADVVDATDDGVQYGAGPDSTLLAFKLRVTPFLEGLSDKITATVSVDGRQRSLPDFEYTLSTAGEDATAQYVVAVPDDRREVELELKYAGLPQTFDLLDGERTGDQPDILYRSSDSPGVHVENLTPAKLNVKDEDGEPGAYTMSVTTASLSYFTTELGDQPSDKGNAWLTVAYEETVDGTVAYSGGSSACTLPFEVFTLTDGGGATYTVASQHSTMEAFEDKVLVFEVPADLADATLTAVPQTLSCADGGGADLFTVDNPAEVKISFPED
jgi:hypothetical protein